MIRDGLAKVNNELVKKYFAFIPGETYRNWLVHCGATMNDLAQMEKGDIHADVEFDPEPKMHFRQMAIHRTLLTEEENQKALPYRCHINGRKRSIKQARYNAVMRFDRDEIKDVLIKRSGERCWPMAPKSYRQSSVSLAFARLMETFIPDSFTGLPSTISKSKTVLQDQSLIRINKKTDGMAYPSLEGIHQDGVEISSVTVVGSSNITQPAISRLWPLSTPAGDYNEELFKSNKGPFGKENCLFNRVLNNWDTIIFNDRLVKHEGRPFDGLMGAYRDIIVCDLRMPFSDGSDKMLDESGRIVSIQ